MRRMLMVAGLAAAVAVPAVTVPSAASARDPCQQRAHDRKVAGTVIGAVGGALVGNAINKGEGAVIGGIGGAVIGNNLARKKCDRGRVAYRTRYVDRTPARYSSGYGAPRCRYENRRYYDERGNVIYTPVQVCR